jgi:solute carrier family 50 protein (sugar transporter)
MEFKDLILNHLFPIAGFCTSSFIFYSPLESVREASQTGNLGEMNTFVFPMMVLNCVAWMIYAMFERNGYILAPNLVGFIFGMYYCLTTIPIQQPKSRVATIRILMFAIASCFFIGGFTFICFWGTKTGNLILGIQCVLILIVFYSAPLSVISKAIQV